MTWGYVFPPEPAAEMAMGIGDGGEGPAIVIDNGLPDVDGPVEHASGRNVWHVEGHDANDQVTFRWRPLCNALPIAWHVPAILVDHLVDDVANVQIVIRVYDTDGNLVHTLACTEALAWTTEVIAPADGTILAGTWVVGARFTIEVDVTLDDGDNAYVEAPIYPPMGA